MEVVLPALDWTGWRTRFIFFTGKGGVGKTTIAAATAVALADRGHRVLVVSTDPASNLDDVFEMVVGPQPVLVPGSSRLWVQNIDPESAVAAYRDRVISPYSGVVSAEELRALTEQLSGQCTVEVAAFDQFARLLAQPDLSAEYDHLILDTAPTGHTLRLLSLPTAWSGYIAASTTGASCLGPLAGLDAKREEYTATVHALADARSTTLVLVARAEKGSLAEAARAGHELAALGIENQRLIVNGLLTHPLEGDVVAQEIARRQQKAMSMLPAQLQMLKVEMVPLVASNLIGVRALRDLAAGRDPDLDSSSGTPKVPAEEPQLPDMDSLIRSLAADSRGLVMVMGKGGVGKTRIASDIALALAHLGHRVHLSTTDPAGNPAAAIGSDRPETLTVDRIDPGLEVRRYTEMKMADALNKTPEERALLAEDLRSPCTEEIAVFVAFSRILGEARDRFVVLDTAPTGHTLLLLDTTGAYHREILRSAPATSGRLTTPLMRLQDPSYTKVLIVTLAETTPVQEAAELQGELRRAGVEPYGWVINAALTGSGTKDPLLRRRMEHEAPHLRRVSEELSLRTWLVPWRSQPDMVTTPARVQGQSEITPPAPSP